MPSGRRRIPNQLAETTEPHLRGAILVAAVFDAYFTVYIKRTRALMRLSRAGGASIQTGELHPDLAELLASEASRVAAHFVNICIRAIDYCPPLDLQFGEYLRALITADSDLVPDDPWNYRAELITAFRLRGIIPQGVKSYSEESLRWRGPETRWGAMESCEGLDYGLGQGVPPEDKDEADTRRRERATRNAIVLNAFAKRNAELLGLDPELPIQPHSFHGIHRVSPAGKLVVNFVVEFLQRREEPELPELGPSRPSNTVAAPPSFLMNTAGFATSSRRASKTRTVRSGSRSFVPRWLPARLASLTAQAIRWAR